MIPSTDPTKHLGIYNIFDRVILETDECETLTEIQHEQHNQRRKTTTEYNGKVFK